MLLIVYSLVLVLVVVNIDIALKCLELADGPNMISLKNENRKWDINIEWETQTSNNPPIIAVKTNVTNLY